MFRSFLFAVFLTLSTVTVAADAIKTVTLEVQGMNCAACPITVKKALKKVPGVAEVAVDYKAGTAEVIYDAGKVSSDDLAMATTAAGYPTTVKEVH